MTFSCITCCFKMQHNKRKGLSVTDDKSGIGMEDRKPTDEEKDSEASADGNVSSGESDPNEGESAILCGGNSAPPQTQQQPTAQSSKVEHRRCALCNCGEWSPPWAEGSCIATSLQQTGWS
uniref:Histone-lysine N-methyltransferase 2D-like isoform X3 n=1 Tax=Geotrypetes seraphini TaxID=260995 RepID=A0A6P8QET9_GEOSA|nr:histone-lysine N-methyltransferase 2D-like isoform X3 [Geotrypetes seraphini]